MTTPELVKVKALRAFTDTTESGQYHGDPNGDDEAAQYPMVEAARLDRLVRTGRVEEIEAEEAEAGPEPDIENGGDAAAETVPGFAMKHTGGGWYEITGPGLAEPEKVQGKADATARLDELTSAGGDDAPPA